MDNFENCEIEINFYDEEELFSDCTVILLEDKKTGNCIVRYFDNTFKNVDRFFICTSDSCFIDKLIDACDTGIVQNRYNHSIYSMYWWDFNRHITTLFNYDKSEWNIIKTIQNNKIVQLKDKTTDKYYYRIIEDHIIYYADLEYFPKEFFDSKNSCIVFDELTKIAFIKWFDLLTEERGIIIPQELCEKFNIYLKRNASVQVLINSELEKYSAAWTKCQITDQNLPVCI